MEVYRDETGEILKRFREERISRADGYLADPAGHPLDAINFARHALAVSPEENLDSLTEYEQDDMTELAEQFGMPEKNQ